MGFSDPSQAGGIGVAVGTSAVSVGTANFSNANNVTFGISGSTVTASASEAVINRWPPAEFIPYSLISGTQGSMPYPNAATADLGGGSTRSSLSFNMYPLDIPQPIAYSQVVGARWVNTVNGTGSQSAYFGLGLYTKTAATFSLLSAFYYGENNSQNSISQQSHYWWGGTNSAANSGSTTSGNMGHMSYLREVNFTTIATQATLTAGRYYIAALKSHISAGINNSYAAAGIVHSGVVGHNNAGWAGLGLGFSVTAPGGLGTFSSTLSATSTEFPSMPNSVATSLVKIDQNNASYFFRPYLVFNG